jgi:ABC-type transport system involved in multi-copper enzyme maturation permease subunit
MITKFHRGLLIACLVFSGLIALSGSAVAQSEWLLFSGILCLFPIIIWIVIILIGLWVYRDAESRGMSGVLWLIVILVGSLIGLIIYLILRNDHPVLPPGSRSTKSGYPPQEHSRPPLHCPNCNVEMQYNDQFKKWYCNKCREYRY